MTIKEAWKAVNDSANTIFYLYERWQDEKEYEDIKDYLAVVQKSVPGAYKMTRRPFGFKAKCEDGELAVSVKLDGRYIKLFGKMCHA